MEELKYLIGISLIDGVGHIRAKQLIAYLGSAEAVFKEKKENLLKIPNIGKKTISNINTNEILKKAEEEINFIDRYNIKAFSYLNKNYPKRLKECADSPIILFSKGNVNFNEKKIISIVGTRKITSEGKKNCEKLIKELKLRNHNVIIVSGLAYGVDICAHKMALQNSFSNIAVLAHGLDHIYPQKHRDVAKEITRNGALVTEFSSNAKIIGASFVNRNRIIAGLSDATIIVESAEKGGSLFTAEFANNYNREVFAFPGRVNDKYSVGCNRLIKRTKSHLLESVKDIEYILRWEKDKDVKKQLNLNFYLDLKKEEKIIVEILKEKNSSLEEIAFKSKIKDKKLYTLLLELEFKDVIKNIPGNIYQILL